MDNNTFHLEFPFTKVDKERRVVIGIATADNIDKSDDIVDFDASMQAFKNWVGNIREMHAPRAVGRALSYRPTDIFIDGSVSKGIEVEAYVSKGAEDTWQKVLDGTLTGFSIGGHVEDHRNEFHSKMNKMVRRITKYGLGELSLVDNPCNPVAHISVVKNHDGNLTYELNKNDNYDVYFCRNCGIATYDEKTCSLCSHEMINIGAVNRFDAESLTKMIDDYLKGGGDMEDLQKNEKDDTILGVEDNIDTSDNTEVSSSSTVTVDVVKQIASSLVPHFNIFTSGSSTTSDYVVTTDTTNTTGPDSDIEKSEESEETVEGGEEVNTEELLKGLSEMMDSKLDEFKEQITVTVDEKIEAVTKAAEVSEADAEDESLEKSDEAEVDEKDELIKRLEERLEALESKKAIKKSIDDDSDDDDTEVITKNTTSVWEGMFLPQEVVTALGYES